MPDPTCRTPGCNNPTHRPIYDRFDAAQAFCRRCLDAIESYAVWRLTEGSPKRA